MKSKWALAGIAIILIVGLSGCGRVKGSGVVNNNHVQSQATAVQDQPFIRTVTPSIESVDSTQEASQTPAATLKPQTQTATPTPVVLQPTASFDLNQNVNDLSEILNNLTKDLNSTDTMDDVK